VLHVAGASVDANAGDRIYLVWAGPNVIMNDDRLRGLVVAGSDVAGRESPDNDAQTARNLRRILRNAAAGARLIQADGLDRESAADVAAALPMRSKSLRAGAGSRPTNSTRAEMVRRAHQLASSAPNPGEQRTWRVPECSRSIPRTSTLVEVAP
jgi:hypothetical protein